MKRALALFVTLAAIAVTVGVIWSYESWTSRGGEAVREERALPPFDRIAIEGFADLILVQGNAESISIEGAPWQLRKLRIAVDEGRLVLINPEARHSWLDLLGVRARPLRATLTYRTFNTIDVAGMAKIRADRLETDRLAISASGATSLAISALEAKDLIVIGSGAIKMDVAGRTVTQRIVISGAGKYSGAKLDSETASVVVSGAGRVAIRAEKALDVELSGVGSVEYSGDPRVTRRINGAGRIKRRSEQ